MYLFTSERQDSNPRPPERTRVLSQLSYVPLCASCFSAGIVNLSEVLRYAQFIWVRPSEIICRAVTPGKQGVCKMNENQVFTFGFRLHIIMFHRDKGGHFQFSQNISASVSSHSHPYTSSYASETSGSSDQPPSHHSDRR